MIVVLIALLVLLIGVVSAVAIGKFGSDALKDARLDDPTGTSAFVLPTGRLGSEGAQRVQIDQALRGYNMTQVDAVLDKLFAEIGELERENDALRQDNRHGASH